MIVVSPFGDLRAWTRTQAEYLSKSWWLLLVTGALSAVAGAIIVLNGWTVDGLVAFIGALLVVRGVFTAFSVPVDGSLRAWSVVLGLLEVAVGLGVWVKPDPTLLIVAFYIGWLLLFRGVMTITGSIAGRRFVPYWGLILVAGIIEVLASFYLLARPDVTLVATVFAIGLTSIFYGVLEIVLAFEVKRLPERFDTMVGSRDRKLDAVA